MRRPVLALVILSTIGLAPRAALAEDRWRPFNTERVGAIICPGTREMHDMGHFFCLSLDCASAGGSLEYTVAIAGGGVTRTVFPATLSVDGQVETPLSFRATPQTRYLEYRAPVDIAAHSPLIAALQDGTQARIILDPAGDHTVQDIPLAGSRGAIGYALRQCRLP